jgi:hypothetical protein
MWHHLVPSVSAPFSSLVTRTRFAGQESYTTGAKAQFLLTWVNDSTWRPRFHTHAQHKR